MEQTLEGSGDSKDKGKEKEKSTVDKAGPWTVVQKPKRTKKKGFQKTGVQAVEKGEGNRVSQGRQMVQAKENGSRFMVLNEEKGIDIMDETIMNILEERPCNEKEDPNNMRGVNGIREGEHVGETKVEKRQKNKNLKSQSRLIIASKGFTKSNLKEE